MRTRGADHRTDIASGTAYLRLLGFLAVFATLQIAWQSVQDSWERRALVHEATVVPAVALINILTPQVHATADGFTVQARDGSLAIKNGCEGVEAFFLLCAAFSVTPIPWALRWRGLLAGIGVAWLTNQARILTLFYAYRENPSWFEPLHATVTPLLMVVVVGVYFYAWLSHAQHRLAATA